MGDDAGEERGVLKLQLPPVWSCTAALQAGNNNDNNNGSNERATQGPFFGVVKESGLTGSPGLWTKMIQFLRTVLCSHDDR